MNGECFKTHLLKSDCLLVIRKTPLNKLSERYHILTQKDKSKLTFYISLCKVSYHII